MEQLLVIKEIFDYYPPDAVPRRKLYQVTKTFISTAQGRGCPLNDWNAFWGWLYDPEYAVLSREMFPLTEQGYRDFCTVRDTPHDAREKRFYDSDRQAVFEAYRALIRAVNPTPGRPSGRKISPSTARHMRRREGRVPVIT